MLPGEELGVNGHQSQTAIDQHKSAQPLRGPGQQQDASQSQTSGRQQAPGLAQGDCSFECDQRAQEAEHHQHAMTLGQIGPVHGCRESGQQEASVQSGK